MQKSGIKTMPKYVAIVGGSCSGKSWLAARLEERLNGLACRLSQDSFYHDRSHLPLHRRDRLNFDHPRAIDWETLEQVVLTSEVGKPTAVPCYDFATHSRHSSTEWAPKQIVLLDGLWLLRRRNLRKALAFSLFLEASKDLCAQRRMERDQTERGRTPESIQQQLESAVFPMHEKFVAPQARYAQVVLQRPPEEQDIQALAAQIKQLISF